MQSTADKGSQFTRKTLEAISLWGETNMQVLRQLLDCSASTAREGLNLSTELQTSVFEAAKQGQSYMLQRLSELPDAPKQPMDYYQKSLMAYVDTAEQVYKLQLGNAQVLLRSAEQVGIVTQQASKRIQESYKELADKLLADVPGEEVEAHKLGLASDLHWLISEGYVIEFNDGSLDLPRAKAPPAAVSERPEEKTELTPPNKADEKPVAMPGVETIDPIAGERFGDPPLPVENPIAK